MQGPDRMDETNEGMIPRSIAQVFESASQLSSSGWEVSCGVLISAIYCRDDEFVLILVSVQDGGQFS